MIEIWSNRNKTKYGLIAILALKMLNARIADQILCNVATVVDGCVPIVGEQTTGFVESAGLCNLVLDGRMVSVEGLTDNGRAKIMKPQINPFILLTKLGRSWADISGLTNNQ